MPTRVSAEPISPIRVALLRHTALDRDRQEHRFCEQRTALHPGRPRTIDQRAHRAEVTKEFERGAKFEQARDAEPDREDQRQAVARAAKAHQRIGGDGESSGRRR